MLSVVHPVKGGVENVHFIAGVHAQRENGPIVCVRFLDLPCAPL